MPARSPLAPFLEPLERLGLPYCVTGSVAASVYGEPRLTADIDVVLLLKTEDVARLRTAFPDAEYYVPPEETLLVEISRSSRGAFNLIHHATQFKADIYLAATDPVTQYGSPRRSSGSRNGASGLRAGMQERPARLEFQPLRRPVRMRGPQPRDPQLDSRFV